VAWQFTDGVIGPFPHNTPGVGNGDLSRDEGLAALMGNENALIARRNVLRKVLVRYGCRRRVRQHQSLGPRCRRWFAEGDAINRRIRHP